MSAWRRISACLCLVIAMAGCDPGESPLSTEISPAIVGAALELDPGRPPEHRSTLLARELPGFGGLYMQDGAVHVVFTNEADFERVRPRIAAFAAVDPAIVRRTRQPLEIVMIRGDYSFTELKTWRDVLEGPLAAIPGVVMISLNQSANRIVVGINDAAAASEVVAQAVNRGIAPGALKIQEYHIDPNAGAAHGHTLRNYHHVLRGGLLFARWGDVWPAGCTLGFVGIHGGSTRLFGSSHCADLDGLNRIGKGYGKLFYHQLAQDEAQYQAGMVINDPKTSNLPGCPFLQTCRYSDVALMQLSLTFDAMLGHIARTGGPGTLLIDQNNPTFRIVGTADYPQQNDTVHMMSATSGWRTGIISGNFCALLPRAHNQTLICQAEALHSSQGGDSGSPVFIRIGDSGDVLLAGIHVAGSTTAWFSPFGGIKKDFGSITVNAPGTDPPPPPPPPPPPFTVAIQGPAEMPEYTQCLFTAMPSGGALPYSFVWRINGSPFATGQSTYYTSGAGSFQIEVTVTDANNAVAIDWIDVFVHGNAPQCTEM